MGVGVFSQHSACYYTVSQKKTRNYILYNNLNNMSSITIIFSIVSIQSMRHRKMVSFPTSTIYTLGNHRKQKNDKFSRKQHTVL